jgi:hypothetical protein
MDRIRWQYASEGTIYGTVHKYDTEGNDIGAQDLTGYQLYFSVKTKYDPNGTTIIQKSIGTGINLNVGTSGLFTIALQSANVTWPPQEYFYGMFINAPSAGTTDLKSVGSGIFEITKGVKYG